ncbi:MAG: tyrosine-type recombinase/integrase [Nitrospinales bacterium]
MYGSGYSCNEAMPDGIAGFETLPILGMWLSGARGSHPCALQDPYVTVSRHTAPTVQPMAGSQIPKTQIISVHVMILLRTGMRICELLALKPEDINLRMRTIHILESAKNGQGRILYISDDAYKALRKWMKVRDQKRKYLFHTRSRENMSYETARSAFMKCIRRSFLLKKGYTLHCLRHTFASELLSAGMPLESLQVLMGHSHIEITRRYARLTNTALENDYFRSMEIIERGNINGSYRHDFKI